MRILVIILFFFLNIPQGYAETNQKIICKKIYTPFKDKNRARYQSIKRRAISFYGDHRNTYIKGHKHSGLDLKGHYNERIYAIGNGQVVDIHLGFPHRTVVVKHLVHGKYLRYSVYKHIEQIRVKVGDFVTKNTIVGRLFNRREQKRSGFGVCHLHFEIKHDIGDKGYASWTSMTMTELNKYCMDPRKFFRKYLK